MKAYLWTTGILFLLLTLVHVWRVVQEPTRDPFIIAITLLTAGLFAWAMRLLRAPRT